MLAQKHDIIKLLLAKVAGKYFKINGLGVLTQTNTGCIIPYMINTVALLTRVKPEIKAKLSDMAKADKRSLSAFVAIALSDYCKAK